MVAQPGEYFTLCKPGMVGDGVGRAAFSVSGEPLAATGDDAEQNQQAVDLYAAFVKDQVEQLLPAVDTFATSYESGRRRRAAPSSRRSRLLRAHRADGRVARRPRPAIDFREVDAVADGLDWTGFHRIEKDLWVPARTR